MRFALLALCLAGSPAQADTILSEVSGNWAGASGAGFAFRAVLSQVEDRTRLQIWQGLDAAPAEGAAQFDNDAIALSAFATAQKLELLTNENGTILGVTTRFADEEGAGQEVLLISFLDNQFTVIGYAHDSMLGIGNDPKVHLLCEVDLWNGTAVVNGVATVLPPTDFEAKNASLWTFGAAFDRGYCPRGA